MPQELALTFFWLSVGMRAESCPTEEVLSDDIWELFRISNRNRHQLSCSYEAIIRDLLLDSFNLFLEKHIEIYCYKIFILSVFLFEISNEV